MNLILFFLILLTLLSYSVYTNSKLLTNIDISILEFFHTLQSKINDIFFSTITWLGSLWIIAPLFTICIIVLFRNGLQQMIFPLFIGFFGTIISTYSLKYLYERKRPDIFDTIGDLPFDPSFPSAHTSQSFIFALLIILILFHQQFEGRYIIGTVLLLLALFVAISRMYLQVHYFSDIIAGILIVLVWTLITYSLLNK